MRVLIAGLGNHRGFGLTSLRDAGHFVGILDFPQRIPVDQCDWWRAADPYSLDSMCEAANSADFAWDAVLCWEELSIDLAREVAAKLGVPGTRMPAGRFRDKHAMHSRLQEKGIPSPQLGLARTLEECVTLADGRLPVVLKPADFGGSGGVTVVNRAEDLADAFTAAASLSPGGRVVVDGYVAGQEFSVEAVTWAPQDVQVVAVVEKHLTRPPYCLELGHVVPATASGPVREALEEATVRALDALGMEAGVCHAEFRVTEEGPVLMEIAGRPAGDQIPRLVALSTGWNIHLAELAAVVGERTTAGRAAEECAAIRYFAGDGTAPFTYPVTVENAGRPPLSGLLRELRHFKDEGPVYRAPQGPQDRLGYAILAGDRTDVTSALTVLADGEEVYRGDQKAL